MSYWEQMNPKSMLDAVGLAPRSESFYFSETILPALAIFSAGLVVGASVALLVTPKSGPELRDQISRKASQLTETVKEKLPRAMQQIENSQHG